MKLLSILAFLLGTLSLARGQTAVADWTSVKLANISTTSNGYYFWPDPDTGAPRVLVTGSTGTWLMETGGPLSWTASGTNPDLSMRIGGFYPNTAAGSLLVDTNSGALQVVTIANGITTPSTLISSGVASLNATSCIVTVSGVNVTTHVAYTFADASSNYYVGYASRTNGGVWTTRTFTTGSLGVSGVGIYATTATDAKIYYNLGNSPAASALRVWNGILPQTSTTIAVGGSAYGPMAYCAGNFYFASIAGSYTSILAFNPSTQGLTAYAAIPANAAGGPVFTSIQAAIGPDSQPRIVAYDYTSGSVYYVKTDSTYGKVATVAGPPALGVADVLGIMYDPNGVPLVLYRKAKNNAYVAYPSELVDADGNGRIDLVDTALGSSTAGVTVPDIVSAVDNVTNSDNRFKIQFPVLTGSVLGTGTDLGTVKHTAKNFIYRVQMSSDLVNWSPAPASATTFKVTLNTVSGVRIATAVFADTLPSATLPVRYARVVVSRITEEL